MWVRCGWRVSPSLVGHGQRWSDSKDCSPGASSRDSVARPSPPGASSRDSVTRPSPPGASNRDSVARPSPWPLEAVARRVLAVTGVLQGGSESHPPHWLRTQLVLWERRKPPGLQDCLPEGSSWGQVVEGGPALMGLLLSLIMASAGGGGPNPHPSGPSSR